VPNVAEGLIVLLEDPDREVQLTAAGSLCKLGRTQEAIGTLADVYGGSDEPLRTRARQIMTHPATDHRPFLAWLIPELGSKDVKRREGAFDVLMLIAGPEEIEAGLQSAAGSPDPETGRWASSKLERMRDETSASRGIGQNALGPH
jgi:hypothetical protein